MRKTKENIIKRVAIGICDLACLLVMIYMLDLYIQASLSLSNFILLSLSLLYFMAMVLGITEFIIRGKASFFKSFKQAFNLVFDRLLGTGLKIE